MGRFSVSYRSGTSFARGLTIDPLLSQEDSDVLYKRWKKEWGEPLEFQGGAVAITCDMVMGVPLPELVKIYGKARAERLIKAAEPFANR